MAVGHSGEGNGLTKAGLAGQGPPEAGAGVVDGVKVKGIQHANVLLPIGGAAVALLHGPHVHCLCSGSPGPPPPHCRGSC